MAGNELENLKTGLPLDAAGKIVDAALAAGRAAGMLPLTVAVLDAGGHLVSFKREDGSGILRPDIAVLAAVRRKGTRRWI